MFEDQHGQKDTQRVHWFRDLAIFVSQVALGESWDLLGSPNN
jgi:hypothetical protein